jgi:hypothetical protein
VILFLAIILSLPAAAADTLLIGDSHTAGFFGQKLYKEIDAARFAVGGTTALHWAQNEICPDQKKCPFRYGYATPAIPTLKGGTPPPSHMAGLIGSLKATGAKTVVVALGTNDANRSSCDPSAIEPMMKLLKQLGDRPCYWVGPPLYRQGPLQQSCGKKYDAFVNEMKNRIGDRCVFIDSRKILDPQTGRPVETDLSDKLHFSKRTGEIWAEAVAAEISKAKKAEKEIAGYLESFASLTDASSPADCYGAVYRATQE